ncbi:hypothetical protein H9P43_004597 [Blastocladiella emersonii ATCC 22665]|nr:hypothetical protein H9P43_004597 [Blastocladiella emersonii ATCC 22665]
MSAQPAGYRNGGDSPLARPGSFHDDARPEHAAGAATDSASANYAPRTFGLHGFVGPSADARFHRTSLWRRALHLYFTYVLYAGTVMFAAVAFAVAVAVTYPAFKAENGVIFKLLGLAVYAFVFMAFSRSIVRTAVRMIIWVWSSHRAYEDSQYGPLLASLRGSVFWVPARVASCLLDDVVQKIVDAYMRHRDQTNSDSSAPAMPPASSTEDAETAAKDAKAAERAKREMQVRSGLIALALVVTTAIPLGVLAYLFGYEAVVSVVAFATVIGSMIFIILVNALNRVHRVVRFMKALDAGIEDNQRLAMYVASAGQESKESSFDHLVDQALVTLLFLFVIGGFVTKWKDAELIVAVVVAVGLLLLARLKGMVKRQFWQCFCQPTKDLGQRHAPLSIFCTRSVVVTIGLVSLAMLDQSPVDLDAGSRFAVLEQLGADPQGGSIRVLSRTYWLLLIAYLVVYIGAEAAFVLPGIVRSRMLAIVLAAAYLAKVGVYASFIMLELKGYASTCILLLTYLSFDLRDARAYWSIPSTRAGGSNRRLAVNSATAMLFGAGAVLASLVLGAAVAFFRDAGVRTTADPATMATLFPPTAAPLRASAIPACSVQFGRVPANATGLLTPLSMSTLAAATYGTGNADVAALARANPVLRDAGVRVHNSSLAVAGSRGIRKVGSSVQYYEYRFDAAPDVSVVAVRGTAASDWMHVAYVWTTPSLIKMSASVGSMTQLWPRKLAAWFVKFITDHVAYTGLLDFAPVSTAVAELVARNRTVVLAGHSLGGGVAQIVAAVHRVPAMSLSTPGLGLSYQNYPVDAAAIARWSFNVIPLRNPIPMLDVQIATLMHIPCDQEMPATCHKAVESVKTLLEYCYDYPKRAA